MNLDNLCKILAKLFKTKISSEHFIVKSFSLIECYYSLNNIKLTIDNSVSAYDMVNHTIRINLNEIVKQVENFEHKYIDKDLLFKFFIIITLIHEFIHAKQYSLINSSSQEFEAKLLRILFKEETIICIPYLRYYYQNIGSYNEIADKRNMQYCKYYNLNPLERMANYNSTQISLKIMNILNDDNLKNILENQEKIFKLKDYIKLKNIIPPIFQYASSVNLEIELNKLLSKYDLYEFPLDFRLGYGLPITESEYNKEKSLIKKMIKI